MTDEEETPAAAAAAVADTPTPTTNNENENDNNNNDTSTSIIEPKQEEEEEEEEDHHQNEDAPESSSTPPGEEDEEDADHGADAADAADAANTPMMASADPSEAAVQVHKKKRLCRRPGCSKVIKSQGHCQRHGAKAKRCKVDGCDKQAQGTHDGMCKRHWKSVHWPEAAAGVAGGGGGGRPGVANPNQSFSSLGNSNSNNLVNGNGGNHNKEALLPPAPEGESVYDSILPQSISYRPTLINKSSLPDLEPGEDPPPPPSGISVMPLVGFLREGATSKEVGWHRNAERRSRGLFPISNLSVQLEPWERQLALVEILLLSGGTPYANFRDLAHAWGRDKGFHQVIVNHVCERRGEVERKRRCDAGKPLTEDRLENFRTKYKRSRPSNSSSSRHPNNNHDSNPTEQQEQLQMQPPHHHQEDDSNHGMVLPPIGGEAAAAAAAAAMMEETTTTATVMTTTLPGSMAPPPNVTATEI